MAERQEIVWKLLQVALPLVLAVSFAAMGTSAKAISCNVDSTIPEGYTEILGISDRTNAHAGLPGENDYNYRVVCTSEYVDIDNSGGKEFVLLSSDTNAHAGTPESSSYVNPAELGSKASGVTINTTSISSGSCEDKGESYVCLATLSRSDNAHVASCNDKDDEAYDLRLCGRIVDNTPPAISCNNCITPRAAETGQQVKIDPKVEDEGFGLKSVDICLDRQCSEVICGSTDCTYVSNSPESNDVYVRAVDIQGNSVVERIGGMFIGYPIGESCSDNNECISGNCDDGVCKSQQVPPDVEFRRGGGEFDTLQMGILERRSINVSVSNFLPFEDSIKISFGGRAANGLVAGNISEDSGVDCNDRNSVCNVSVPPSTEKKIGALIQGLSAGSGALSINARSYSTEMEAEDSIEITTRPRTEEGPVSAPGMTGIYLFVLLLLATFYVSTRRKLLN